VRGHPKKDQDTRFNGLHCLPGQRC